MTHAQVVELLRSYRIPFGNESEMQDAVRAALTAAGVTFHAELKLTDYDRIDFFVEPTGIGIECKVDGGPSAVLAQLIRYAASDDVASIVLLTSRHTHRFKATELRGKPLSIIWVAGTL